ncbi:hypothetical protein QJS64_20230 (plasmid) [Paraclostridium bifermentans]|uniref:DUF4429 domain-containing protein n=1 Tax=Paraclostridium bifermentans TaxID=1490 RepID=A0ABY8R822_PARBF|nr:hypothetical protein QJS64_20230 [Paraclostridium bifermentans]
MDKNEIMLGSGEIYMMEFTGEKIPEHATLEVDENNVGYCNSGFKIDYKPKKYDVKNQYGRVVKSFITDEQISVKTGIITWDLDKLALLSTAKITEDAEKKIKKLTFGGGGSLKTVLLRFVHDENGKKLRFTMIGQGGNGFGLDFGDKETTINAELQGIEFIKNFLAEFEQEL